MDNTMTTLEKIHDSAKKEFLEKGFLGASLRNIVKYAGVTTGAFYGIMAARRSSLMRLYLSSTSILWRCMSVRRTVLRSLMRMYSSRIWEK